MTKLTHVVQYVASHTACLPMEETDLLLLLQALQADVAEHQSDLDSLSDSAQDLVRLSTDTRVVSQASQLATKYHSLSVNVKVRTDQGTRQPPSG